MEPRRIAEVQRQMHWEAWAIIFAVLVAAGGAIRGMAVLQRRRALAVLPESQIQRISRGITLKILVEGTRALAGMTPGRAHRTRGDLALTADRFLITSGRGVLVDLGPTHGRRFTSVRCTGPGKLVIEGDVPRGDGKVGLFRIEAFLDDAMAWVESLQPFVDAPEDGPRYGTFEGSGVPGAPPVS